MKTLSTQQRAAFAEKYTAQRTTPKTFTPTPKDQLPTPWYLDFDAPGEPKL